MEKMKIIYKGRIFGSNIEMFDKISFQANFKKFLEINPQSVSLLSEEITQNNLYQIIYDVIYELSMRNKNEFFRIQDEMIAYVRSEIEKKLDDLNVFIDHSGDNSYHKIMLKKFIEVYKDSEIILEKTKMLMSNHQTRFEKDILPNMKINNLNHKNIILEYLNSNLNGKSIVENIKIYLKNISSDNEDTYIYKDNFVYTILKFILSIGARGVFNEFLEHQREKILMKYKIISEEFFKSHSILGEENLSEYLTKYDEKIQNECFNYKILFGENEAFLLGDKLKEIMFISKLPNILNSKLIFDNIIISQKFLLLEIIYKLLNRKIDYLILFQDKFFEFFIERFYSDIKVPLNLKEGLTYIDFLLERINKLNMIFNDCFGKDRRIQLRYKETLSRMINNKNIKNMYMLCGVYLNEIMCRSFGDFKMIEKSLNSLSQILYSIEDVENFFLTAQKFFIKRVSNFKFVKENEKYMMKLLREIFGSRYCFALYRLLDDIEITEKFFEANARNLFSLNSTGGVSNSDSSSTSLPSNVKINIFSFNAINKNDLTTVLNKFSPELDEISKTIINSYQSKYPHRIVNVSQNLSTCIIKFNTTDNCSESYSNLLVNFIQASILLQFLKKSTTIKVEDIIAVFEIKNIPIFRLNIISLIHAGILKFFNKKDSTDLLNKDELTTNMKYKSNTTSNNKSPLVNLTNVSELATQYNKNNHREKNNLDKIDDDNELSLNRNHTSQSDINSIENSMESQSAIYNSNKFYIIDSKVIKIIKAYVGGNLEHHIMIKTLIIESKKIFGETNIPDLYVIQKRIDCLIERNLITRTIDNGKIIYNYC